MVGRVPALVVLLAAAAAAGSVYLTTQRLGIDTNTVDMLSADLPWRVENERHKRLFPHYADNIVVVIRGATADLAADAQRRLGAHLRAEPDLFREVHLTGGGEFFERNALLYANLDELQDLADGLEKAEAWLPGLERDPDLGRFLTVLDSMLIADRGPPAEAAEHTEADSAEVADAADAAGVSDADDEGRAVELLGAVGGAFESSMVDRVQPLPWRDLMSGHRTSPEELRRYIEILPRLDFDLLFPGEPALTRIRTVADSLGLTAKDGVGVRLTGFVPMSEEELRSAAGGMKTAGALALIMVGLILYAGLRSARLIAAALITLLVGLVLTAAFAALAVGHLNLISMAFAVLYIGLGIDYAIHYSLRYRELRTRGAENQDALQQTAGDVGASLLMSAVTTAACFFAFVPTDFEGVSELGLIGGAGMLISFAITITLLPALFSLVPFRPTPGEAPLVGGVLPRGLANGVTRHRRAVLFGAAVVALASVALLPRARFDLDPLALRDPEGESTATFLELLGDSTARPMTVSVLAADREEAEEIAAGLERLEGVEAAISLDDFVPGGQEAKLAAVERIARALGTAPEARDLPTTEVPEKSTPPTPGPSERMADVERFRRSVRGLELEPDEVDLGRFVTFQIRNWQRRMEDLPQRRQERALERVEESLVGGLGRSLADLRTSLAARSISEEHLPEELVRRWVAADGTRRVEVIPRADLGDEEALRAFVAEVRTIAPRATGEPVINVSAGEAVVAAFRRALIGAAIATLLLLLLALRSVPDASRVMIPLLLAGAMTGAATVLFGIAFNYANVIALPLLLGVGVDNGIHMVHRRRAGTAPDRGLLETSTARAVLYASLTTIFSFGNLAFSSHPGTASMGRLLTIGMLAVLVCTLVVLPALAEPRRASRKPVVSPEDVSIGEPIGV
jgi:hopanoid biosynthesis associated RND transporter like protein HpnN